MTEMVQEEGCFRKGVQERDGLAGVLKLNPDDSPGTSFPGR